VRADGLDLAVVGLADGTGGLEVLLASPALGQDGQRQVDLDVGHGCSRVVAVAVAAPAGMRFCLWKLLR
jgi:hypothetical protein